MWRKSQKRNRGKFIKGCWRTASDISAIKVESECKRWKFSFHPGFRRVRNVVVSNYFPLPLSLSLPLHFLSTIYHHTSLFLSIPLFFRAAMLSFRSSISSPYLSNNRNDDIMGNEGKQGKEVRKFLKIQFNRAPQEIVIIEYEWETLSVGG